MEILNNIWMVLTTSNEFYKNICVLPLSPIEAYIGMALFLTILNISTNTSRKALYIILFTLTSDICHFFIPSPFNIFIIYVSAFIFIVFIFKVTPFKAIICLISPIAIFGVISTLILNPYLTIFNITSEQLSTIPIYNIGHLLLIYLISYILILILRIKNFKIDLLEDIDKKNKNIIFANFIFGFITLIIQGCITFYYIDNLPILITFLSFLSLLAYFSVSIYSLTRAVKLNLTTKKLESAKEYNRSLCILHDNVRSFKHDFDNIVTTIGGYVRTNDMDGLKQYYIELEDDCQRVNNLYLLNPEIINNPRYL